MRIASRLVVATALLLALVSGSPTVLAQSRVQPSLGQEAPKPADLPAVRCGMTLIPGDPAIDSKIQRPARADGRQFTMRTVVPKICQP